MPSVHRAIDLVATWVEDRRTTAPVPFRPAPATPLDCFGPLPACPDPPARSGAWRLESPRATGFPAGDRLTVHVSRSRGASRGVAIVVPPWQIDRVSLVAGWRRLLERAGWEVWIAVPPHHLDRCRDGARSGDGFVSPDLAAFRASVEQLVLELRLLTAAARARGGEVAMIGLSLGALATGLAATAPERLDAAALVGPPDVHAVLHRTPIGRRLRRLAARAGAPAPPPERARPMLDAFRPDARPPTARRILVAGGRDDAIATSVGAIAIARAWGLAPRLYPRGHLTLLFACAAVRRDLLAFLAEGRAYLPATQASRAFTTSS